MKRRSHRARPDRHIPLSHLERLEDRRLLAAFTVVNTADSGAGSLRQAILDANAAPNPASGVDQILFDIPGSGVQTIQPTSDPLPEITDPVSIDGYTQPGSSPNSNPVNSADNATLLIELHGSTLEFRAGLSITAGGSSIRGLVINGFSHGVLMTGTGGNRVAGNFIGTNVTGTEARPNSIGIVAESPDNTIGGTAAADRNIISGNGSGGSGFGIYVSRVAIGFEGGARTSIQGNFIGTDVTGTVAIPNHTRWRGYQHRPGHNHRRHRVGRAKPHFEQLWGRNPSR